MSKKYYRKAVIWITKEQSDKIKESGLGDSEFIRQAIDEKDYQFVEMKNRMHNAIVEDIISYLYDKKKEDCHTTGMTNHYKTEEIVIQNTSKIDDCHTTLSDKKEGIVIQNPVDAFGKSLQTVVNLVQTTGKLNNTQKDVISNKLGITAHELQERVDEYHDELLKMDVGHY